MNTSSSEDMDFDQTQAFTLFSDESSDTEVSKIIVHLNIPIQDNVKEAKQFLLKEGPNIIGRNNSCDVPIPHNALSKKHAVIEIDKDSCLIYDAGSQNKTWKGKLLLKPNVKYNLEHDDSIKFANVKTYITIEQLKEENEDAGSETGSESMIPNNEENEDAGSETGSESVIPNNNDPICSNITMSVDKEHKIRTEDEVLSKEHSMNQPEKLEKAIDSSGDTIDDEKLMKIATLPYNKCDDSGSETTDDERLVNAVMQPYSEQIISNKKCNDAAGETADDERLMNAVTQPYNAQTISSLKHNDSVDETTDDDRLMNAVTQPYNAQTTSNKKCNDSSGETTDDEILMNAVTQPYNAQIISNKKCNDAAGETADDERLMDVVTQPYNAQTISSLKHNDSVDETTDDDRLMNAVTQPYNAQTTSNKKCNDSEGETTDDEILMNAVTQPYNAQIISNKKCNDAAGETADDERLMDAVTQPYNAQTISSLKHNDSVNETTDDDRLMNAVTQPYNAQTTSNKKCNDSSGETTDDEILMNAITQPYNAQIISNKKCNDAAGETADDERLMNAATQPYNMQTVTNERPNDSDDGSASNEISINTVKQPKDASTTPFEKCTDYANESANGEQIMVKDRVSYNNNDHLNDENDKTLMNAPTLPYDQLKESWNETIEKKATIVETASVSNYNGSATSTMHENKSVNFSNASCTTNDCISNNTCKKNNVSDKSADTFIELLKPNKEEITADEDLVNQPTQCYLQPESIERIPNKVQPDITMSSTTEIHKFAPQDVDVMAETICFSESDDDLLNACTQPYHHILTDLVGDKTQKSTKHENFPPSVSHDTHLIKKNKTTVSQTEFSKLSENNNDSHTNALMQCNSKTVNSSSHVTNKTNVLYITSDKHNCKVSPTDIFIAETVPFSQADTNIDGANIDMFVAETQELDLSPTCAESINKIQQCKLFTRQNEALKISCEKCDTDNEINTNTEGIMNNKDNLKLRATQEPSSGLHLHPLVKKQTSKVKLQHVLLESDAGSSFSAFSSKLMLEESLADLSSNDILCASTQPQDIDEIKQAIQQKAEVDAECDFLAETQEDVISGYDRNDIEKTAYDHCVNTPPFSPNCDWVAETPPDLLESSKENNTESLLGKLRSSLKQLEHAKETQISVSIGSQPKSNIDSATEKTTSLHTKNNINFQIQKNSNCDLNIGYVERLKESEENNTNSEEMSSTSIYKRTKKSSRNTDIDVCSNNKNEACANSLKESDNARLDLTKKDDKQIFAHCTEEEADSDKNIEKCIRRSKRKLQNDGSSCTNKKKIVKSLAHEGANCQKANEDYNDCHSLTKDDGNTTVQENKNEEFHMDGKINSKITVKNKNMRDEDNCRNKIAVTISKRTKKSKHVKNVKASAFAASEKATITVEPDIEVTINPSVGRKMRPQNSSQSERQIISTDQETTAKSPTKVKKSTRNKSNNITEESKSNTISLLDNNAGGVFVNTKSSDCKQKAVSLKSPERKHSKRIKEILSADCHLNLGNIVEALKTSNDNSEITHKKNTNKTKALSDKGHESENMNSTNDSNIDNSTVGSLESNRTNKDSSCSSYQQRKSSRQRKSKSHPEFEVYTSKQPSNHQSVPITTSPENAKDSTSLDRKKNSREKRNEDIHAEKNIGNTTQLKRNKKKESKIQNRNTRNDLRESIDSIATKLLEKRKNVNIHHSNEPIGAEVIPEIVYTTSCDVQDKQLKELSTAKMIQRSKRRRTEIEDQSKCSELLAYDLEIAKHPELQQGTLFPDRSESIINACRSESIDDIELNHTENSKASDSIKEGVQTKKTCRSTTRSRKKKLTEYSNKSLLDLEQDQNKLEENSDVFVSKDVKMLCNTRSSNISQNKKLPINQKLDVENIETDSNSKQAKSESESKETETINKGRKSPRKRKSNVVSKSKKKSFAKKILVEENNELDTSKQMEIKHADANISKQIKLESPNKSFAMLDSNKTPTVEPSKSTVGEKDFGLNIPKQLNSRNKRKRSINMENSLSSNESLSSNLNSPSKTRRKTQPLLQTSQTSANKRKKPKLKIMFTGIPDNEGQKIVTKLGGEIVDDPKVCTHLVTDKFRRTVKMICSIAQGIPVVEIKWLEESKSAASFVDAFKYLLKDKAAEKQYKFSLQETLQQAAVTPLFQGWSMYATTNVKPSPDQIKDIVQSAGGKYLARIPARFSEKTVIISCPEDLKLCKHAAKSGIPIVGAEFLLTGLLRYENDIVANQLSVG